MESNQLDNLGAAGLNIGMKKEREEGRKEE